MRIILILGITFFTAASFSQPLLLNPKLVFIASDALSRNVALKFFHIPARRAAVEKEREVRFSELLPKAKVARIVVSRYSLWHTDKEQGTRKIKSLLSDLEKNRLEGPLTIPRTTLPWTLDFRLKFVDGKSMRFVTDFGLVAVEDSKGVWRVYRSLPANYKKVTFPENRIVFAKDATMLDRSSVPSFEAIKAAPKEHQRTVLDRPGRMMDLLDNQEVLRVLVTKYPGDYAEGLVRKAIVQLLSLEVEEAQPRITWAEGNNWFLECRLELGIRGAVRLVTDGWHFYLEDTRGYGWFSRISANEYRRGYDWPQMLPR